MSLEGTQIMALRQGSAFKACFLPLFVSSVTRCIPRGAGPQQHSYIALQPPLGQPLSLTGSYPKAQGDYARGKGAISLAEGADKAS